MRNKLLVSCVTVVVCGCHQPATEIFPAIEPAMVWPAAPERPRVKLIGALAGSGDLNAARSGGEVFKAALRGPRPPIRFSGPHAVAYHPQGKLAVADSAGAAVHIANLHARTHVTSYGSKDHRFAAPVGVAWVGDRLFVCDAQLHEIIELDVAGKVVRRFGEDQLRRPVGLAYIPERNQLYVVDGGAHAIQIYDTAGNRQGTLGSRGVGPGEFNYPTHIAFDGVDRLAVADTGNFRVQLLDLDGRSLGSVGRKGDAAGDLALPKGVAFDSDGHLYVVDAQFENFQIFDRQNRLLLSVGREGSALGRFSLPAGLTIDEEDRIWVADAANRRVQVFQYLKEAGQTRLSAVDGGMDN